jgi:hypothetical protein
MSEFTPRIPPRPAADDPSATDLDRAASSFAATAMRATSVDPVTTELVRLRCAQYHDCRLCASLRLDDARDTVDEAMTAKIARYETSDLPDSTKAALRLADTVIIHPNSVDPALYGQLREHFSDEQIAELLIDIMKWSYQKVHVSLRLETPPWDGLNTLSFDESGHHVIGADELVSSAHAGAAASVS